MKALAPRFVTTSSRLRHSVAAGAVALGLAVPFLAAPVGASLPVTTFSSVTFTVTTTTDTHAVISLNNECLDASNQCSLRAAIEQANSESEPVIINVPAGTYDTTLGALEVTSTYGVTINGAGPTKTIVDASGTGDRAIDVEPGQVTVALNGLTLTNGTAPSTGLDNFDGGALASNGANNSVSLTNVDITNSTADNGGGIETDGSISLKNVTMSHDTATDGYGGGVDLEDGVASIDDSTFTNDSSSGSDGQGGAIYGGGVITIAGSTFTSNSATGYSTWVGAGGAVYLTEQSSITSSTFTSNSAGPAVGAVNASGVGGAIWSCYGTNELSGLTLHNNEVMSDGTGDAEGGAIVLGCGNTTLANDTFTGNSATAQGSGQAYGGGLSVGDEVTENASPATAQLTNDVFTSNDVTSDTNVAFGGAVVNGNNDNEGGSVGITHSTFTSNHATSGSSSQIQGGGAFADVSCGGGSLITSSTFTSNEAIDGQGGALLNDSCGEQLVNDRFTLNKATGTTPAAPDAQQNGVGGALDLYDTTSVIDTVVTDNQADSLGGGVYSDDEQYFFGVTVSNNSAPLGAGMFTDSPSSNFVDTALIDNTGTGANSEGGGLWTSGGLNLTGSTIAGNTADDGAGVFSFAGSILLKSTVISDNHITGTTTESSCDGSAINETFGSLGGNRIGDDTCELANVTDRQGSSNNGYIAATKSGKVFGFNAVAHGGPTAAQIAKDGPVVGETLNPNGTGYWLVTQKGFVFGYGSSVANGSVKATAVAIASTPDGGGYWVLEASGKVVGFGDAPNLGSAAGPSTALGVSPDGQGYWVLSAAGTVTAFGTATKFKALAASVTKGLTFISMTTTPDGLGAWLLTSKGTVIVLGTAKSFGHAAAGAVAIAATPNGDGYWILTSTGLVETFGSALSKGSPAANDHTSSGLVSLAGV